MKSLAAEVSSELAQVFSESRYERIRSDYIRASKRLKTERQRMSDEDFWECVRAITVWHEEGRP